MPLGLVAFIRDAGATNAVWSESAGYPADPVYRDFYRDIGFDLSADYLSGHLEEPGERIFTGLKYWAVTGRTNDKRPYDSAAALAKAGRHAEQFLAERRASAAAAAPLMDRPPLMVCPFDAELFGHWWFEGPAFLEALFRKAAQSGDLRMITLGDYYRAFPENQVSTPEFSSWGDGGYAEVWLDGSNDWIYRHAAKAVERMSELAERFPTRRASASGSSTKRRARSSSRCARTGLSSCARGGPRASPGSRSRIPYPILPGSTTCSAPIRSVPNG
jgi:1,4-alpha-glucan branching enzyme